MSIQRIFYVTCYEMVAYRLQKGAWLLDARFPSGSQSMPALDEYLATSRELLSCLYTDLIEEEYRNEAIPHLNGRDRKALVERKLRQQFRTTPFRAAHVQGRKKREQSKGRREDKVLFAALTNPDNLNHWLEKLAEYKIPLAGIYSLPMVSRRLLRKLDLKFEHTLLLTEQQGALLRQSFFNDFDLKASRLVPIKTQNHDERIATLLREVQKNQRYLSRMQLLPHDALLNVCILTNAEDIASLRAGCPNSATVHYHFIDINQAMAELGLQGEMAASQSEELFLHLLHESLKTINYARPIDKCYCQMRQLRRGMMVLSLLFTLLSAAVTLNNLNNMGHIKSRQSGLDHQMQQVEADYQQALLELPDSPIEPRDMQSAVTAYSKLKARRSSPRALLSAFSKGLDSNPRVQLEGLAWQSSDRAEMGVEKAIRRDDGMKGGMEETPMGEASMAVEAKVPALYKIAILKGRLEPVGSDYSENFKLVEAFINSLRQTHYFIEVSAVRMPLEVDPSFELSGDYLQEKRSPIGTFEIKAVVRVGHDV